MPQKKFEDSIYKIFGQFLPDHFALAISGGSDSIALLHLFSNFAKKNNINLSIFYVDHNLREESKEEVDFVKSYSNALGWKFYSLEWNNRNCNLHSRVQEQARKARYSLMIQKSNELSIQTIITAHHKNDLLENYLMRKKKKSGVFGLSYSDSYFIDDIHIARPLLPFNKQELLNYLIHNKIRWVEDVSNSSDKYERNRYRKKINRLDESEKAKLFSEMEYNNKKTQSLNNDFICAIAEAAQISNMGFAIINLEKYKNYILDIQIQLVNYILTIISGKNNLPRFRNVKNILSKIISGEEFTSSLHGCIITSKNKRLLIYREKSDISNELVTPSMWDNRFQITSQNDFNYNVASLSQEDYTEIKENLDLSLIKNPLPFGSKSILFTLPVIKKLEKIVAIPHISYYTEKAFDNNFKIMFKPSFVSRFTHFL